MKETSINISGYEEWKTILTPDHILLLIIIYDQPWLNTVALKMSVIGGL